jgi:hypothetical protein
VRSRGPTSRWYRLFETYAPVDAWSTVSHLLVLSVVLSLTTKQVDYITAFVQADMKDEIDMEMADLFKQKGKILRLKNLCMLQSGLEAREFRSSQLDAPGPIDAAIASLKSQFDLHEEDDGAGFLGVHMDRRRQ